MDWISAVTGEKFSGEYEDVLKNGIVLCKLINAIAPGSVKKIQEKGTNFQLMENIQRFQAGIKKYGVPEEEIFQTADLFEKRNIAQVTLCLYALARLVRIYWRNRFPLNAFLIETILADPIAPRVQRTPTGTEDGRQERAHVHRRAAQGQRRTLGTADGTEQGSHSIWTRWLRKHAPHVKMCVPEKYR